MYVFEINKMTNNIKKYQEKWTNHVHRMPDDRPPISVQLQALRKAKFRKTTNEMD
jgi:hypothetical protein